MVYKMFQICFKSVSNLSQSCFVDSLRGICKYLIHNYNLFLKIIANFIKN